MALLHSRFCEVPSIRSNLCNVFLVVCRGHYGLSGVLTFNSLGSLPFPKKTISHEHWSCWNLFPPRNWTGRRSLAGFAAEVTTNTIQFGLHIFWSSFHFFWTCACLMDLTTILLDMLTCFLGLPWTWPCCRECRAPLLVTHWVSHILPILPSSS